MKRPIAVLTAALLACSLLTSCGGSSSAKPASSASSAVSESAAASEAAESKAEEAKSEAAESKAEEAKSEAAESEAEEAKSEAAESEAAESEAAESEAEEAKSEAAESEAAESEAAESEAEEAKSEAAESEAAVSEAAESEAAESEAAESEVAESEAAESEVAESEAAESEVAESEAAESEVAESEAAESEVAESEAAESEVAESEAAESEVAESEAAESEAAESEAAESEVAESEAAESEVAESEAAVSEAAESEAAAEVAALIDAIYVQERTDETDEQCAAAKAAWDALTDEEKEMVEGEFADPDYFGRDTGDASADDPRNADDIGENEILVVSFGTSFNDSRATDIKGIEDAVAEAFPEWQVRRGFTAQIIINHVEARDGEFIDNVDQALQRAVDNGVKNLVIQPTHLMHGAEYDELIASVEEYADNFESIAVAEPLLGEVGEDASVVNEDKEAVAVAVTAEAVAEAGYDSLDAAKEDGTAFVFIGHGTAHVANVTYSQMQSQMGELGYENVFIGTVEGEPEGTECEAIIDAVKEAGYTKVVLRPLMVVAGDHANNDMADPEDPESWYSLFDASGAFEQIDCQIAGLGRIADVQALYVEHTQAAVDAIAGEGEETAAESEAAESETAEEAAAVSAAEEGTDAAAEAAALIDAIYVQERTDETDEQCAAAKAAWDALTDEEKEMVEGEFADPDYFGRDTGDASADDPRNADDIGENEILVVSFGTSFNDSRATDIKGIEDAVAEAFPEWQVRRGFTAQIIINHVEARDGEFIDNVDQALQRAVDNGVKNLVIQPTHLMHGAEYDELIASVEEYADNFESIAVAEPLLGEVGEDASVVNEDKEAVAVAVTAEAVAEAGYDSLDAAKEDGTAFVFIGHGTAHVANVTYSQMQSQMGELGYENVFIGTVEGEPEGTECEAIIDAVKEAGYTKVVLRPLMVVAGDHANNDMADPEDPESWYSLFDASGAFEQIDCQIAGLGRIADVQALYIAHTQAAVDLIPAETAEETEAVSASSAAEETAAVSAAAESEASDVPADGVYTAAFTTDSSMFHVNEANEGRGILTVENGEMTIHVSLASKNIVNLFPGLAEDAQQDGAELLQPTTDEVAYSDGTTDEVYGFDIPVPALDEEFDCALVGTKGKWYDHKVMVSDLQPYEE